LIYHSHQKPNNMKRIIFTLIILAAGFATQAQELAPDQNPNYAVSMDKYKATQTNLQTTMNTTVQDTYKAYDFRVARAERQAERRSFRRDRRLFNNYNDNWNYNGFNNSYYGNNWNNNGWNNYNNGCRNNRFRWIW
jgi:hypothetical protein